MKLTLVEKIKSDGEIISHNYEMDMSAIFNGIILHFWIRPPEFGGSKVAYIRLEDRINNPNKEIPFIEIDDRGGTNTLYKSYNNQYVAGDYSSLFDYLDNHYYKFRERNSDYGTVACVAIERFGYNGGEYGKIPFGPVKFSTKLINESREVKIDILLKSTTP